MVCPICKNNETTLFFSHSPNLIICKNCRHVFWDKTPSQSELNSYYTSKYTSSHNQLEIQIQNISYYRKHVKELIDTHNGNPSTILDYGCSFPLFLIEAKKQNLVNCIGVEWDQESRKYGEGRGIEMTAPRDLDFLPDNSIDIARFSHVLEHLIDPLQTLKGITAKLKKGGLIYITQPSFPVFKFDISSIELMDSVFPEHLHFFSPISLIQLIDNCELVVEKFFTHQFANESVCKYVESLDIYYASTKLNELKDMGDDFFGNNCNYPLYSGQNSVLFARK